MISVLLVDDQHLVREGIATLLGLSPLIHICGEAANGVQALTLIPALQPDVVLMDIRMPGMSGIEVMRQLAGQGQLPPTIILTTFDDHDCVLDGLRAGAKGYLLKDVKLDVLVQAIVAVQQGRSVVQPAYTERVANSLTAAAPSFPASAAPETLSERETEVLRLLAAGLSNKEIAQALHLSEGTIKNHVSNILAKLGVRDRTRAVLKAIDSGWI